MSPRNPSVAIVIRTRDIEPNLAELLVRLSKQTFKASEIVVVDNFSSEASLGEMQQLLSKDKKQLFNRSSLKLVPLNDNDFSHAYSTNLGVSVADADLVSLTNGHSFPFSEYWLEIGVAYFKRPEVAGVGGYFTAHENGTLWEKLGYSLAWKRYNELTRAYAEDSHFSTVNCIVRKSMWQKYPFDERLPNVIPQTQKFGGEDYDWAQEMRARGYTIVVDPRFSVIHSHGEKVVQMLAKNMVWRQIRRNIRSLRRPRKSYTRLKDIESSYLSL